MCCLNIEKSYKQSLPGKPLITVLTVVFNAEKHLEDSIKSVINQTYDNVEYIIIDGGSTDGTLNLLKKYDCQIDYWVSENDKGIYDAINKGILSARGDYIYVLGGDDALNDNTVLSKVALDITTTQSDALFYSITTERRVMSPKGFPHFLLKNTIPHQGAFISMTVHSKLIYNLKYKVLADYDLLFQLLQLNYKLHFSEFVVAKYSVDGVSGRGKLLNYLEEHTIRSNYTNIFISSILFFYSMARWLRKVIIYKLLV